MTKPTEGGELPRGGSIYVPGLFRCDECGFQIMSKVISTDTGRVGTSIERPKCLNDGEIMLRVTWPEYAKQLENDIERRAIRERGADAAVRAEVKKAYERACKAVCIHCSTSKEPPFIGIQGWYIHDCSDGDVAVFEECAADEILKLADGGEG